VISEKKNRESEEINASSMADVAFLLLIFFLIATSITSEEGMGFVLPPKSQEENQEVKIHDRNIFKVIINSKDKLLVEDEPFRLEKLRRECKLFIANQGMSPEYSDSPQDAVVSLKADRGTDYKIFLQALNELKAAYHELRAEEIGISVKEYLALDIENNREHRRWYAEAKAKYPLRLSIAEPTDYGN
jgi:biopolymer transport protein ExbD